MWRAGYLRRLGLLSLFVALIGACPAGLASDDSELVIFNWSQYMDPAVIAEFERRNDVAVRQIYFQGDDNRDDLMVETNGKGFDLIMVSGVMVDVYRRQGWIEPLDIAAIPNLRHVGSRWRHAFPSVEDYAVPYAWGTVGIAYRRDLVAEPFTSWQQMFQPAEALRGRILMPDASRDVLGMALKALGYSANSTDAGELRKAARLALQQRPYVAAYSYPSVQQSSPLLTGEIVAAMVYGGDALQIARYNANVRYVLPREGSNLWVDYLTVAANSSHKALAYRFLDFLNRPEIAARLTRYTFLATPNQAARGYLPEAILNNPVIYPDEKALARSEFYRLLSPAALRVRNTLFVRVAHSATAQ